MAADAAARRLAAAVGNWARTPDTLRRLLQDARAELDALTDPDARTRLQDAVHHAQQTLGGWCSSGEISAIETIDHPFRPIMQRLKVYQDARFSRKTPAT
jgi:hypothetical protein